MKKTLKKLDPAVLEYIAEGKEIIERVSKTLIQIENGDIQKDTLSSIYRDVHTLKGTSQLFGFKTTAQVSHALEASLDPIRKGIAKISPQLIDIAAKSVSFLERLIVSIESSGEEAEHTAELNQLIGRLIESATDASSSTNHILLKDDPPIDEGKQTSKAKSVESKKQQKTNISNIIKELSPDLETTTSAASPKSTFVEKSTQATPQPASLEVVTPQYTPPTSSGTNMKESIASSTTAANSANQNATSSAPATEATIRVHVGLLDRILTLVGELVLVKNQLSQFRQRIDEPDFLNASQSLDVVTSDLQGEIMKTRMQPIETVVGKFQRVVRDIARDLGKKIDLTIEGGETELDKSLLEAIKDPLTHIVRNSCDHGIEGPEERLKANKPETGHLLIRSFYEGGQVVVEISDDGRGINRKRVVQKAIEKGLLTAEKASTLSDREICEIIFLPGFSTAQQVSSVSGRGVGMDVVKTNIEKIGGNVEIKSVEGKGTSLQLRIPLTLAIVPALIIKSNNFKFAIPQIKLLELVHVDPMNKSTTQIEKLQNSPMFRLRGDLLPLYDLRNITGEQFSQDYNEDLFIVVLNADGETFGLLVPEVSDTADIVVKPMNSLLSTLSTFSGSTILGDGSIALILDVDGVAEYGNVLSKRAQKEDHETFSKGKQVNQSTDIQEFLLFSVGQETLHSVPLCLVSRLEEFSSDMIEKSGEQYLIRYRNGLLPLISVKDILAYKSTHKSSGQTAQQMSPQDRTSVIVISHSGSSYGLIVDEIVDVLTIEGQIDDSIRDRSGILGNLVHNNEVIAVVDAIGIIEDFNSNLGVKSKKPAANRNVMAELRQLNKEIKSKSIRVLYAEDVAFFRRHVSKVLNSAGIEVVTFEDGQKAIQEIESSDADRYNLVLSDIEMPHMNGLELAKEIRKNDKYKNVPMIALTTRYKQSDIDEGKAAGFNEYLEKLNPEKLLAAISQIMNIKLNVNTQMPAQEEETKT